MNTMVKYYEVQKQFGQAPFQGEGLSIQLLRKEFPAEQ
jgi:hypothetical protein